MQIFLHGGQGKIECSERALADRLCGRWRLSLRIYLFLFNISSFISPSVLAWPATTKYSLHLRSKGVTFNQTII